jgi:nucleoid DNA-binding protein
MAAKKSGKSAKSGKSKVVSSSRDEKPITGKQTKNDIYTTIAGITDLSKKDVKMTFEGLGRLIGRHMRKRGSGEFTIPETGIRVLRKTRPATKKRLGRNPATGEQIWIAGKPARTVIKIRALKALKETVNQ